MEKKLIAPIIILMLFTGSLYAQPAIQWQYSLGGSLGDGLNNANTQKSQISPTSDGGYILAGYARSNDGDVSGHNGPTATTDCWVVKLDSLGSIEWQVSLGGTQNEYGEGVKQTSDGGYIVIATTTSDDGDVTGLHGPPNGNEDAWVVKLDDSGNIEWQSAFGGTGLDGFRSVNQTSDGGYILGGFTTSNDGDVSGNHGGTDFWMVKLNSNGTFAWQKCIGGSNSDIGMDLELVPGNGFVLLATSNSSDGDAIGNTDTISPGACWVVKTDSIGNIQWQDTYGGMLLEFAADIIVTNDGGYAFAAFSMSFDGDLTFNNGFFDYWVVKLNASGGLQWQKSFGGTEGDNAKTLVQTPDNGFLIAGSTTSDDGDISNYIGGFVDGWLVKTDAQGNMEWDRCIGGTSDEEPTSLLITSDGGFVVGCSSLSNDIDVSGHHGPTSETDIWIAKFGPLLTGINEVIVSDLNFTVSPNPVHHQTQLHFTLDNSERVSIEVIDMKGKVVDSRSEKMYSAGSHQYTLDFANMQIASGLYSVKLITSERVTVKKISYQN